MKEIIILFFVGLVIFLILDFIWLNYVIGDFFKSQIGHISNIVSGQFKINLYAAIFVYVLMTLGLLIFVLPVSNSYSQALIYGALFGFVMYGIYDGTNLTFIKDYPLKFALVDISWGTFLVAVTNAALFFVKNKWF
ncbi:DUF2177 family protein [Candidatus Pacearchaeota archaeon]|nr:DUF2177 family protein [Candidatus Pacearchaeota archaeon]